MIHFPITGLVVVTEFISAADSNELLERIDEGQWITELKRRVQHFGYRYFYSSRRVRPSPTVPLPLWATQLLCRLREKKIISQNFNQLIVNEYLPGQGIAPHIDNPLYFDNEIVSLSLGSPCVIAFSRKSKVERLELLLRPGDLLVMRDDARYLWRHEIARRQSDHWEGQIVARTRRISATFRKLLP